MKGSSKNINILGLWLGLLISTERKNNGLSLEFVGEKMGGLQPSYIRMVEKGTSILSASRIFDLLDGLNNLFFLEVLSQELSQYISLMHSLPKEDLSFIRKHLIKCSSLTDDSMEKLILFLTSDKTWELYENENYNELEAELSSDRSINILKRYLSRNLGVKREDKLIEKWKNLYESTPSPLNDFLEKSIDKLDNDISLIKKYKLSYSLVKWEEENSHIINKVWMVLDSVYQVTEFKNESIYTWQFLLNDNFKSLNCFVNKHNKSKEILKKEEQEFLDVIIGSLDKISAKQIRETQDKISFTYIESSTYNNLHHNVPIDVDGEIYEWFVYETKKNKEDKVGFAYTSKVEKGMGGRDESINVYLATTYKALENNEVEKLLQSLEELNYYNI